MGSARTTAVLTGLLLAFPGVALAQSPPSESAQTPDTGQNAPPLSSSAPPSGPSPTRAAPKASTTVAAPARRLPSTGADAGMVALLGAGLLLTGAGLRLRLREPSALPE